MQTTTRLSTIARTVVVSGGLLAALAFGSVAANANEVGLTECDNGCKITNAKYWSVSVTPIDFSAYISNGTGDIGFTR